VSFLRIQTPTLRLELATTADGDELAALAERLRTEHGFPGDWPGHPGWDCAVSPEPVHPEYWARLSETMTELKVCRAQRERLETRLAAANATISEQANQMREQAQRLADLLTGRDVLDELRQIAHQLRGGSP
jgi:hypothetical protein